MQVHSTSSHTARRYYLDRFIKTYRCSLCHAILDDDEGLSMEIAREIEEQVYHRSLTDEETGALRATLQLSPEDLANAHARWCERSCG